jgi:sensor domain CHASE-containing protein
MSSRLDLRDRVTVATALVLALGLGVLTLGVSLLLSHQLDQDVSARLRERADAASSAARRPNGRCRTRPTRSRASPT